MEGFFDQTAEVGSDEEEEFGEDREEDDERPRKSKSTNGALDDSSEEEEDDEEAERAVREGFIVDEDEDEDSSRAARKRAKKKRRREEREEEEALDEEDLDLIGALPADDRTQAQQTKFKRLKRGHREDASESRGMADIFSDDDEGGEDPSGARGPGMFDDDEMAGFIEADEFPDEEGGELDEDLGVRAPNRSGFVDFETLKESGLDEGDFDDMRRAFGLGEEFAWALEAEAEHNEEVMDPDKPLELKDVFEPSQLIEKLLTDADNEIRMEDVPERLQLARRAHKSLSDLSDQEIAEGEAEEAKWITNLLFPKKRVEPRFRDFFEGAITRVLRFLNVDNLEPTFIFQNRKDYLIHSERVLASPGAPNADSLGYVVKAEKLITQTDVWDIMEHDLKYRAFAERRQAIRKHVQLLKESVPGFSDKVLDDLIPMAVQMDDLQDIQEYLNFQHSMEFKDAVSLEAVANGAQKRARGGRSRWDSVRAGPAYHVVRAFGITADQLARNADKSGRRTYTDDPDKRPDDMADSLVRDPDYPTGADVLRDAKAMFVEEIVMNPRMRRHARQLYYEHLVFDVFRTDKGLRQIDDDHPYYEFKYLRNQKVRDFLMDRPDTFLKMLKAESEGLVEVRVRLQNQKRIKADLHKAIESDNSSELADAWNELRVEAIDLAMAKLHKFISKGVKDNVKNECENKIAGYCRDAYTHKLDQAPFKPKGMELGTLPRVLSLTNGGGKREDAVCWAYVEENGRVLESGKFGDLRLGNSEKHSDDGPDVIPFVELVERRKPDVITLSGWSVETRRLYKDLQDIVDKHDLRGTPYVDEETDLERTDPLDVVICNDEVARPYHTSKRAYADHPGLPPLTRYAVALAKYMQDPLKEYAALGSDITSIIFDPSQSLIPQEKLLKQLEAAMVDMVNMVGVEISDAAHDPYTANLLPYVCGLGPRKAAHILKTIHKNGGDIVSRDELVGNVDEGKSQAVGPTIFTNCASFLYIRFDDSDPAADYLDNTRVHPEDYDVARKMAADALEMDEEDIKDETEKNGPAAVVRKLVKDDEQDKVNDLILEDYAVQLESQFSSQKRATLETVRAELQAPYEELRRAFAFPTTEEIFTMLTGETRDTLVEGMIVPVSVKRTSLDHIEVKLDCGIDGSISQLEYPEEMTEGRIEPKQVWALHQTIPAKLQYLDRKKLVAQLTLRETELRIPYRRHLDHGLDEWDDEQEQRDRKAAKKALEASGAHRALRVIKHPLFRPFDSQQAQNFLQPLTRGECVIRPSSKGPDHLAVTWKVADEVYQHIDVLELDKENEFSVGKTLRIGGKYSYSDLDELIVLHVKAMAKKVEEMMGDERYQAHSKDKVGKSRESPAPPFPCRTQPPS